MMIDTFEHITRQLWKNAGLGAPRFGADQSLVMNFDDVDLTLAPSADQEYLCVTTDCGRLEAFGPDTSMHMETLLKLSFALLYSHDVLVHLEGDQVTISGRYHFQTQTLAKLSDLLSDVASAAQTVSRLAQIPQLRFEPVRSVAPQGIEDIVIFQP